MSIHVWMEVIGVCENLFLPGLKFLNDHNKQGHQLRMKRFEERKGMEKNE